MLDEDTWFGNLGNWFVGPGSQFIEDGTFLKLREVSVSYTLTARFVQRAGFSSVDIRLAGRNLWTKTDYTGIDPEANLGGATSSRGNEYFNNPQSTFDGPLLRLQPLTTGANDHVSHDEDTGCRRLSRSAVNGCSNFLSGDKLDSDPNRPTTAQAAQLFTAVQVNSYYILNGHAARVLAMWMQQMAGTDRQYRGYDQYSITEGLFAEYSSAYTGGGLIDIRTDPGDAEESGNRVLGGIAKVWEALVMSFVADMYGDATYSEAVDGNAHPQPVLDAQATIYAALQTVLDGAITDLTSGQGAVGDLDLSLGGDPQAWMHVARTLKARLYLHTAEVNPSAYTAGAVGPLLGRDADHLHAWASSRLPVTSTSTTAVHRARRTSGGSSSLVTATATCGPGKFLVDLMNSRSDPRRAEYLQLNAIRHVRRRRAGRRSRRGQALEPRPDEARSVVSTSRS